MTRVLTTMWGGEWWSARTDLADRRKGRLRFLWEFVRTAPDYDVVVVCGALAARDLYIDLIATGLLKLRRRRPAVVVTDATWEVGSQTLEAKLGPAKALVPLIARAAIRAVDAPRNVYCVLSTDELEMFPATWGIERDRVVFTPFCVTLYDWVDAEPSEGDYLFAGGESLRDHRLLVRAVDGLDVPLRIAASHVPTPLPPNVVAGRVPHDEYMRLLLGCRAVVVPLLPTVRSAGQQTYLNGMALGKPVVVTDAPGVRDYIDDGVTGFIVPPDVRALRERLAWLCEPANAAAVAAVAAAGREAARSEFMPQQYVERLLEVADLAATR